MSYLVCDKCGEYYKLQEGEFPEDFNNKCDCGGTLVYSDNLNELETSSKEENFLILYLITPCVLIFISASNICAIFYDMYFITLFGIIGVIFGLIFLFIRIRDLERKLHLKLRQVIYSVSAIIFLTEGCALIVLWPLINIGDTIRTKIAIAIFIFLAIIFGLNMILKTIHPDNHRNKLDMPLKYLFKKK